MSGEGDAGDGAGCSDNFLMYGHGINMILVADTEIWSIHIKGEEDYQYTSKIIRESCCLNLEDSSLNVRPKETETVLLCI